MASNELVNKETGEIEEPVQGNIYGDHLNEFPKAHDSKAKAEQFNALNAANSLNDFKGDTMTIVGFVVMPGSRAIRDAITGNDTGQYAPTDDTILLDDQGKGWFTQSHGIAKSVHMILAAYGQPDTWPDGKLTVKVASTKTRAGSMKLLQVVG